MFSILCVTAAEKPNWFTWIMDMIRYEFRDKLSMDIPFWQSYYPTDNVNNLKRIFAAINRLIGTCCYSSGTGSEHVFGVFLYFFKTQVLTAELRFFKQARIIIFKTRIFSYYHHKYADRMSIPVHILPRIFQRNKEVDFLCEERPVLWCSIFL